MSSCTMSFLIWHVQMEEQRAGKSTDLPDFIFSFFQKRIGIQSAVVEVTCRSLLSCAVSHDCIPCTCSFRMLNNRWLPSGD